MGRRFHRQTYKILTDIGVAQLQLQLAILCWGVTVKPILILFRRGSYLGRIP